MKKLIKKGKLYRLIGFSQPLIVEHTRMLSDNNKGGIVLTYLSADILYIPILKRKIIIRIVRHYSKEKYFKPLKKDWRRDVYKIESMYWGKKNHLLTKLWLKVDNDFKDIFSIAAKELKIARQCKDKELIKQLNIRKDVFILSTNQNRK